MPVPVRVRPVCFTEPQRNPMATQDRHKAPALPVIHPLSLQDDERFLPWPDSVVKDHQNTGGHFLSFPDSGVAIMLQTGRPFLPS